MVMFYYIYVLRSLTDERLYIRYTQNLRKRLYEHRAGLVQSTKSRLPLELVFYEAHRNKYDGLRRERYLKTSKGKTALKRMLREFWTARSNKGCRKESGERGHAEI